MQLADDIENYYFSNLQQIDYDKKFHFLSRLSAWNNNERATRALQAIQADFVKPTDKMIDEIRSLMLSPPDAKINAATLRRPFFEAYPMLRGRILAMFRIRHLRDIYGTDLTKEFTALVSTQELRDLAYRLESDHEAIKTLSTYAINYIYLVRRILYAEESTSIDGLLRTVRQIGNKYDETNPTDIQLLIYLYTHCIIGASNFYLNDIHETERIYYIDMLRHIESVIEANSSLVNLDNKFEFLVCCNLLGYKSSLSTVCMSEAEQSLSEHGTYLVDRHNHNAQSDKTSLSDSEHRNVLFIMSTRIYHG